MRNYLENLEFKIVEEQIVQTKNESDLILCWSKQQFQNIVRDNNNNQIKKRKTENQNTKHIMMFGAMQAGVATAAGGLALKSEALGDVRSSPWFQTPDQASSIG